MLRRWPARAPAVHIGPRMPRSRITLKLATSLDGRIATASGESRWITGEAARAEVHKLRAAHDAVMIGAETARRDDPSLLARTEPAPDHQPVRVVVTSALDIPTSGRLFEGPRLPPLIVFGGPDAPDDRRAALEAAGAQVEWAKLAPNGLSLIDVLEMLEAKDCESVLVEGGGRLAASLIAADVVDRIEWFRAPMVLGAEGRPAVAALALAKLADAPTYRRVALRELGPDIWESYERVS